MRATFYLDALPVGDMVEAARRAEIRMRNKLIMERLEREIEDEGGSVVELERPYQKPEVAPDAGHKSYGRADW